MLQHCRSDNHKNPFLTVFLLLFGKYAVHAVEFKGFLKVPSLRGKEDFYLEIQKRIAYPRPPRIFTRRPDVEQLANRVTPGASVVRRLGIIPPRVTRITHICTH